MVRMRSGTLGTSLARVAARTLPIIEATNEWRAIHVAVLLRVRIMTICATHAAAEIAVAITLVFLVRERAYPTIGRKRPVAEEREGEGVITLERVPREISRTKAVFQGMTLEAHAQ